MAELDISTQKHDLTFTKKVWITAGIFSLVVVLLLLFKTLFNLFLLVFAGILIAIFFHGFAGLLREPDRGFAPEY